MNNWHQWFILFIFVYHSEHFHFRQKHIKDFLFNYFSIYSMKPIKHACIVRHANIWVVFVVHFILVAILKCMGLWYHYSYLYWLWWDVLVYTGMLFLKSFYVGIWWQIKIPKCKHMSSVFLKFMPQRWKRKHLTPPKISSWPKRPPMKIGLVEIS